MYTTFFLYVVYKDMSEAVKKHPEADILINFASLRSAYDATMEALTFEQVWITVSVMITVLCLLTYKGIWLTFDVRVLQNTSL